MSELCMELYLKVNTAGTKPSPAVASSRSPPSHLSDPPTPTMEENYAQPMNLSAPPSAPAPPTMEENCAQVHRRHNRQHVPIQEGYSQVNPTTEDYSKIQHNTGHANNGTNLLPQEGYGKINQDPSPDQVSERGGYHGMGVMFMYPVVFIPHM